MQTAIARYYKTLCHVNFVPVATSEVAGMQHPMLIPPK